MTKNPLVETKTLAVRLDLDAIKQLDDWRREQGEQGDFITRTEAVRRLIATFFGMDYRGLPDSVGDVPRSARHKRAQRDPADIERLYELQGGRCPDCGKKLNGDFHVDHITPIAKGGRDDLSNIQLLHSHCNQLKSTSDPIRHAQRRLKRLL